MLYILMYPVLILTHVPDFLDMSGMGVTLKVYDCEEWILVLF
jgi:hypothetical protein